MRYLAGRNGTSQVTPRGPEAFSGQQLIGARAKCHLGTARVRAVFDEKKHLRIGAGNEGKQGAVEDGTLQLTITRDRRRQQAQLVPAFFGGADLRPACLELPGQGAELPAAERRRRGWLGGARERLEDDAGDGGNPDLLTILLGTKQDGG